MNDKLRMKSIFMMVGLWSVLFASIQSADARNNREIPPKGSVFNESVWMVDSITGRPTLRLTQHRDFNRTPTYHLNACFSEDSRYIILTTSSEGYGSALIQADVTTGDCRVIATRGKDEKSFGDMVCMIPGGEYIAATTDGKVMIYNLKTLKERVLYEAPKGEGFSHPTPSIDGSTLYVNQLPIDMEINRMKIVEIKIATGKSKDIFSDESRGKHVVTNPVDPDLLLIDRDFPPNFARGSDKGKTTRAWILNIKTGALTECRPKNPYSRFQLHTNWSHDGKYVYYHGQANAPENINAHFIGVTDLEGKVVWEATFPYFYYGHICSHTQKHALFTEGLLFPNLITELDWTKPDANNVPPLVIYGVHNSGHYKLGQHTHPHCHMSPDAQKVTYNKGSEKRSDVYILFIGQAEKAAAPIPVQMDQTLMTRAQNRIDNMCQTVQLDDATKQKAVEMVYTFLSTSADLSAQKKENKLSEGEYKVAQKKKYENYLKTLQALIPEDQSIAYEEWLNKPKEERDAAPPAKKKR